ncbi:hypothetical protein ACOSQ4_032197 [Xanthoceras sorbifolium]
MCNVLLPTSTKLALNVLMCVRFNGPCGSMPSHDSHDPTPSLKRASQLSANHGPNSVGRAIVPPPQCPHLGHKLA